MKLSIKNEIMFGHLAIILLMSIIAELLTASIFLKYCIIAIVGGLILI